MSSKESADKAKEKTTEKRPKKTTAKKTAPKEAPKKTTSGGKKKSAPKTPKKETIVGENSLVYVDYVGKIKDEDKVFTTTIEEVAKENDLQEENATYEPYLVAIGWKWFLPILESSMIGMEVGASKTVEVPPEDGAGVRKSELVKKIPLFKLQKQGVRGYVGEEVTFGEEKGTITRNLGRTVLVDFNNPDAGKTWIFDITVREILSDPKEKLKAMVKRRLPGIPSEEYSVDVSGKTVTINLPWRGRYIEHANYVDVGIAQDAFKVIEEADEVKIVISWPRPEPPQTNQT